MGRLFLTLEDHPGRVIALVGIVLGLAYLLAMIRFPPSSGRIMNGDAIQYYAYLRSLAIDHDVDFRNDYALLYGTTAEATDGGRTGAGSPPENRWLSRTTATGRLENMMAIGPALLWMPFFLVTYATLGLLRVGGLDIPLDGVAAPFQLSAGLAGIFFATLGAYLCFRACRLFFPPASALWGTLVAWLASPALYYSLVSPAYSHATSLFATALFCLVWLRTRHRHTVPRYIGLGLLAGLAALVRWQDGSVAILAIGELAVALWRREQRPVRVVRLGAALALAMAAMLLPQLFAWRAIYGAFFVMPQGNGFMLWTRPAVLQVLFSLRHGLFSWTPAVLAGVAGLSLLARRDRSAGGLVIVLFLITVYVNASVSDWWAGEAFGARRFIGMTVILALGSAALFAHRFWIDHPNVVRWSALGLIAYNTLFLLQYQLFMHGHSQLAPYPTTVQQVLFDRLIIPWKLVRLWLSSSGAL